MIQKLTFPKSIHPSFARFLTLSFQKACFLLLSFLSLFQSETQAQYACGCVNCPQNIIDNNSITSIIDVKGAISNNLATAPQGVCRVCVKFKHDFVSDLQVSLISPAGQSIVLLAPVSQQGFTPFSTWNVCFVPCAAIPSPDPGFPAQWTNAGWGALGNYKGSYHPFDGCLEDFNLGAVNGAWKLVVKDGDNLQAGVLFDWSIEFCDPNGIDCIRCEAKGGNLASYPAVSACKGNSKLLLTIPPKYTSSNPAPSAAYYGYNYVISKNDTIKRIQPTADLRTLPAGKYNVCGLSYRLIDAAKIPIADGKLTVTQLKAQIASVAPPYCAQVSAVCVPVEILPNPVTNLDSTACRCVTLNKIKYCQSGFYQQKFKTIEGCDSTVNINVNIIPPRSVTLNATTCKGLPYIIGTKKYTRQGAYKDTLVSIVTGCDSFVTLNLLVRDPNVLNYTKTICEGDSISQAGKYYKTQKIHIDTIKTVAGCDSILKLDLKVNKGNAKNINESRCEGDFVLIEGKKYDKTGIYNIKLNEKSSNGCDSILQLNLKINPIYKDTLRKEICQGDTVRIGKKKYFLTGNHIDTLRSKANCDSIIYSFIEVKNKISINLKKHICQGEIFRFNGKNLSVSGTYNAAGKSKNGCDSLTELILTVHPKPFIKRDYTVCYGDTLKIGTHRYAKTGLYRDTLKTAFGCDSVHESNVVALPRLERYISPKLCKPAVLIIGKYVHTETGIYLDSLKSSTGCDSIIRVDLTVNSPKDTIINLSYCFGKNPSEYPTSKDYIKKLKTATNCDSTITFRVKIYPENKTVITTQICTGAGYTIGNQRFTTAGQHIVKDTSWLTGCDSTIILNLSVTNQIRVTLDKKICESDSIVVGGKAYYSDQNKLEIPLKSDAGCDSIVTLNLQVNPRHFIKIEETICDGSCIVIGGVKYCKGGLYTIETKNRFGCDSLVSIVITIKKRPVTDITASICYGEFYQLGKKKIYESGFHQDTLKAVNGCDSILSLDLNVKPLSKDSIFEIVCYESTLKAGITKSVFKAKNGCDSTYIINRVKLNEKKATLQQTLCKGQTISVGNTIFDKSGTFNVVVPNVGKHKCDSTIILTINVLDSLVENKAVVLCNGETYQHHGVIFSKPINLKEKHTSVNNCDSIYNLSVSVVACKMKYRLSEKPLTCKSNIDAAIIIQGLDSAYINYFYTWTKLSSGFFSNQTILKGNEKDTISGLSAGKYIVRIHNGAGLIKEDTITFVTPKPLTASAQLSNYQGFGLTCANGKDGKISLTVSGGTAPYRYRWNNGMIAANRIGLSAGRYTVVITDSLDCSTVLDTILSQPKAVEVGLKIKTLTCYKSEDGAIEITGITNGTPPYTYSFDRQAFSSTTRFERLSAVPHIISIKDSKGCITDTAFFLKQPDKIKIDLGLDTTINVGEKVLIQASVNLPTAEIKRILWSDFVTPTCPTCLATLVSPTKNTGYLLTIFDKNNCVGFDEYFIFVKDLPIYIPTAFSPNDDGINDGFTIFGDDKVFKIKSLQIYNRWGDIVFDAQNLLPNDPTLGWDGKYKGTRQQTAVFVYTTVIELFDGTTQTLKGEVFLAE
jgi:gliding motility-associated-like protein